MAISLIGLINSVSLKDRGSRRVAASVAYGQEARQRLDVYAPKGARGPVPLIVYFHGGGWDSGDPENYEFIGRSLAALGYVTVLPAYRLLPEVEYPVFLHDCAEAVRFADQSAVPRPPKSTLPRIESPSTVQVITMFSEPLLVWIAA